jgi:hypothetical protein
MRPPPLGAFDHLLGRGHPVEPVGELDRSADPEIAARDHVGSLEVEEQEHLRAPPAQAADRHDLGDDLLVAELRETIELERAVEDVRGEVLQVGRLPAGQPSGAEVLLARRGQLLRRGRPAPEQLQEPSVNRARRLRRKLLPDDGPDQSAERILRALR